MIRFSRKGVSTPRCSRRRESERKGVARAPALLLSRKKKKKKKKKKRERKTNDISGKIQNPTFFKHSFKRVPKCLYSLPSQTLRFRILFRASDRRGSFFLRVFFLNGVVGKEEDVVVVGRHVADRREGELFRQLFRPRVHHDFCVSQSSLFLLRGKSALESLFFSQQVEFRVSYFRVLNRVFFFSLMTFR